MKVQAKFQLDAEAKEKSYAVFQRMGIKPTDAVNIFMHHVALFEELPFRLRIPHEETLAAIREEETPDHLAAFTLDVFKTFLGLDAS